MIFDDVHGIYSNSCGAAAAAAVFACCLWLRLVPLNACNLPTNLMGLFFFLSLSLCLHFFYCGFNIVYMCHTYGGMNLNNGHAVVLGFHFRFYFKFHCFTFVPIEIWRALFVQFTAQQQLDIKSAEL